MASHRFLNPSTMPATRGYTHVVEMRAPCRTGYLAGQIGMTPDGKFAGAPGDFRSQAAQAFKNVKLALAAAGATFDHVVKVTVFVHGHGKSAGLFRSPRPLCEYQHTASLDRGANFKARTRRRFV